MTDEHDHNDLGEDHEPGESWNCPGCGKKKFVCFVCHEVFNSTKTVDHRDEPDRDDDTVSVCDGCHRKFERKLRGRMM